MWLSEVHCLQSAVRWLNKSSVWSEFIRTLVTRFSKCSRNVIVHINLGFNVYVVAVIVQYIDIDQGSWSSKSKELYLLSFSETTIDCIEKFGIKSFDIWVIAAFCPQGGTKPLYIKQHRISIQSLMFIYFIYFFKSQGYKKK